MLARCIVVCVILALTALSPGCTGHAGTRGQADSAGLQITFSLEPARVSAPNHMRVTVLDAQRRAIEVKSIVVHLIGPSGPSDVNAGIPLVNDNDGGYVASDVRLGAPGEWSAIVSIRREGAPLHPTFSFTVGG